MEVPVQVRDFAVRASDQAERAFRHFWNRASIIRRYGPESDEDVGHRALAINREEHERSLNMRVNNACQGSTRSDATAGATEFCELIWCATEKRIQADERLEIASAGVDVAKKADLI